MNIRKKVATVTAALGLASACLVGGAGSAAAGTNGQQLQFYDKVGNVYCVQISGYDLNNQPVFYNLDTPGTTTQLPNVWWWGPISYWTYTSKCSAATADTFIGEYGDNVPQQQASDWYTISQY